MGIVGMLIIIFGTLMKDPFTKNVFFLIGTSALTIYSIQIKHPLFTVMQWVILLGISLAFFPIDNQVKLAILGMTSGFGIASLSKQGKIKKNLNDLTGIGSILGLALGYATAAPIIYLFGGILATLYALLELKSGVKEAWVWALLNSTFVSTVTLQLFLTGLTP